MKTKIVIKFKRGVAISTPNGGILYPRMYPSNQQEATVGTIPTQVYAFDKDLYTIELEEEEKEMPDHMASLGPEVREAFLRTFAQQLAVAHDTNNKIRESLKYYENAGHIEVISDSFIDKTKKKAPAPEQAPIKPGRPKKEAVNETV